MDNPISSTSDFTGSDSPDDTLTPDEQDKTNTITLTYLEALRTAAIGRQTAKQKQEPIPEPFYEGEGELIDLDALNLANVPYYSDPDA